MPKRPRGTSPSVVEVLDSHVLHGDSFDVLDFDKLPGLIVVPNDITYEVYIFPDNLLDPRNWVCARGNLTMIERNCRNKNLPVRNYVGVVGEGIQPVNLLVVHIRSSPCLKHAVASVDNRGVFNNPVICPGHCYSGVRRPLAVKSVGAEMLTRHK